MTRKRRPFFPQDERPPDASGTNADGSTWEVRDLTLSEAAASMGKTESELGDLLDRLESGEARTIPLDEFLAQLKRRRAH